MNPRNEQMSRWLDENKHLLAHAAVARQYRRQPGLLEYYGPAGRAKCVQDVTYHLDNLVAATYAGWPATFVAYVAWAKVVLTTHHVRLADVVVSLECLRDTLLSDAPADLAADLAGYVELALPVLKGDS